MADSSMSAGELRRRYHKGGSAKDSDMSASQIRARHGVKNREFAGAVSAGGGNQMTIIIAAVVILVLGAVGFFFAT